MSTHVIVNLAESEAFGGLTGKVKTALEAYAGFKTKHHWFCKTTKVSRATIHKFDLVEAFDEHRKFFGIPWDVLIDLRLKIDAADSVFYCAHGSATDRDVVFTEREGRSVRLTNVTGFADFARLILSTRKVHDLRLIVCFAARSMNPDSRHTRIFLSRGANDHLALKSSLAYKFYKRLDDAGIRSKMYARIGEVRVSQTMAYKMEILTQTEEGVIAGLAKNGAVQTEERLGMLVPHMRHFELGLKVKANLDLGVLNVAETNWVRALRDKHRLTQMEEQEATETGNGRLCYERIGAHLRISFQGGEIYRGAFF